jgi:hypothetical protein
MQDRHLNGHCFVQKGFGEEEQPGIQLELEKFFNKYGKTNAVRMRRIESTKAFKVCRMRPVLVLGKNLKFVIGICLRRICRF